MLHKFILECKSFILTWESWNFHLNKTSEKCNLAGPFWKLKLFISFRFLDQFVKTNLLSFWLICYQNLTTKFIKNYSSGDKYQSSQWYRPKMNMTSTTKTKLFSWFKVRNVTSNFSCYRNRRINPTFYQSLLLLKYCHQSSTHWSYFYCSPILCNAHFI